MPTLNVEVVTGERVVFTESDVDMVIAPGSEGTLGILPRHAPLITTLAAGELRILKGNVEQSIVVFGGFMEVTPDDVTVLADTAERADDIDLTRAEAAVARAREQLASGGAENFAEISEVLERATNRLKIAQMSREK